MNLDNNEHLLKRIKELEEENNYLKNTLNKQNPALSDRLLEFNTVIETTQDGYFVVDLNGKFIKCNSAYLNLLGYSEEEFLQLHINDVDANESPEDTKVRIENLLKNGYDLFESKHRKKNGELVDVEISTSYLNIDNGKMVVFVRVITNRKKSAELLLKSEQKYRFLFDNMVQGVIYHDATGAILEANNAASEILGLTKEQLFGKTSFDPRWRSIHPDGTEYSGDKHPAAITLQTGLPVKNAIMGVFVPEKNSYNWININSYPLSNQEAKVFVTFENITDFKNAEIALRESEEKYRFITENVSDVIWVLNLNLGKFTFISSTIMQLRGLTVEEALSENFEETLNPESQKIVKDKIAASLPIFLNNPADGIYYITEIQQPHKDGRLIWIEVSTRYRFNSKNEIEVIGVSRNIDERKRLEFQRNEMENALKESEEKFRLLFENMSSGFALHQIILDEDNNPVDYLFIDINPAFERITGLKANDLIGKTLLQVIPDSEKYWIEIYGKVALSGESIEYDNYSKGLNKYFEVKAFSPSKYHFATIFNDITSRKEAEEALRNSEAKLRAIFENTNVCISMIDLTGKYIYFNNNWCNFLGYSADEIVNLTNLDITHQDDILLTKSNTDKVLKKQIHNYRMEKRYIRKDSKVVWGDLSVAAIYDKYGEVEYFVGLIVDISERKIAEEKLNSYSIELEMMNNELLQSKELIEENLIQKSILVEELELATQQLKKVITEKDKFFSIIAHDLKNPLGSFKQLTKLMHDSYNDFSDEERVEILEILKNNSDNLYELLENLLDWARSQRGTLQFNPVDFVAYVIVKNTIEVLSITANSKNIQIINNVPKSKVITADPNLIMLIFRNLISNSIKFTKIGGEIEVGILNPKDVNSIEFKENTNIFFVKDNGVGISEKYIDDVFKIDKSISTPGTNNEKGTGLGLILCKEFVEKHKGKIWIESEVGKGTTIFFEIP